MKQDNPRARTSVMLMPLRLSVREIWKVVKFALVGTATAAVYFVILTFAVSIINSTWISAAIAYLGSAIFNYFSQRNLTFRTRLANSVSVRRYLIMHAVMMILNSAA